MHFLASLDGKTIFGAVCVIGAIFILIKGMKTPPGGSGKSNGSSTSSTTSTTTTTTTSNDNNTTK